MDDLPALNEQPEAFFAEGWYVENMMDYCSYNGVLEINHAAPEVSHAAQVGLCSTKNA